jgi:transcriptional regulator with XRE-family HTH domain
MTPPLEIPMAPAPDNETFGSRIRRLRRERGLNQRRLAAQVGIDFTYLSKLENNQSGQSPGEDLIRRLAEKLGEDPEDLLAMAGKVPVDALRARAREDPEFARSLRRLPDVPDSRITGLIAPPEEMAALGDAHIKATLRRSPGITSFRSDFVANQDEYLVAVVREAVHRSRLRDANVPIHDILVAPLPGHPDGGPSADEIAKTYEVSVAYRDGEAGDYVRAELETVDDVSALWQPQLPDDHFPLVVLRARFPTQRDQERRIELGYEYQLFNPEWGYWFWTASRPMFVSTITVDAADLERTCECHFGRFLPNFERVQSEGGKHVVEVSNWLLKGHGVMLMWRSITGRVGS